MDENREDETRDAVRLNLGGGGVEVPGHINIDRQNGDEAYPLPYDDNSVDAIRASHILEHFGYAETPDVLKEWVRVLKPGGTLKIAVPDLNTIIEAYQSGGSFPIEGYLCGGQTDENDFHKAIFNRQKLFGLLHKAGLKDVQPWKSKVEDCASLPISVNLMGTKPPPDEELPGLSDQLKVVGAMSMPRLGFTEHMVCSFHAMVPLKIDMKIVTGAFWHQCLENCIEDIITESDPDAILTLDYDTIFTKSDVAVMMRLMLEHPEVDALTSLQAKRQCDTPLLTIRDPETGENAAHIEWDRFEAPMTQIRTAHFGLTLLRKSALLDMPKPWFLPVPGDGNRWRENRKDADMYFWDKWDSEGKTLFMANRIVVGHIESMISWPNQQFQTIHQHVADYHKDGKPTEAWQ